MMRNVIVYIHGKGGSVSEAERYVSMFPEDTVIGFDYQSQTPWEAQKEFGKYVDTVSEGDNKVVLIANSIGAFFSLCALSEKKIEKAYFISPIVDMEKLICDMMACSNVTEAELEAKREIQTEFEETLSWEYLKWVRNHTIRWNIPTEILYGENDGLQSIETISAFARKSGAGLTVMKNGEHWFHTAEQMSFSDDWLKRKNS